MDAGFEFKMTGTLPEYEQEVAGRQERVAEPTCDCPLPAAQVLAQYVTPPDACTCPPMFVP